MTKLEFIDREISSTEIDIWYSNSILKETPQKEELKREMLEVKINVLKQKMFMLQQIKTDLEAWEVVKKNLKVYPDETIRLETKEWMTIYTNYKDQYQTLKKALEEE